MIRAMPRALAMLDDIDEYSSDDRVCDHRRRVERKGSGREGRLRAVKSLVIAAEVVGRVQHRVSIGMLDN